MNEDKTYKTFLKSVIILFHLKSLPFDIKTSYYTDQMQDKYEGRT